MATSTSNITTNTINVSSGTSASNTYTYTIPSYNWNDCITTTNINPWTVSIGDVSLEDYIKQICDSELKNETTKEEKKTMTTKFNFGPITDGSVKLSMRGIAVKNTTGEYVCYDDMKDEIVSVDGMTMDCGEMIYAMPVALKDVEMGDLIIHNKHYCYVMDGDENILNVLDISDGTVKDIMPTKSPFGFNFVTKVTSLINLGKASADSPFGDNFFTYIMMMNGKLDKSLLPLIMTQTDQKIDPMMLALLLK